ncbi:hypothetical protein P7K49_009860 [Saguinus oedipus]|uniref:Uncharacterized protein n=1 Tax=Saguinus oedipus TaxID=9490 RepID=A0ABQ9VL54_SAGOE|nr:hypothetical protein P7K49_009860 [Saguinus oedipus]
MVPMRSGTNRCFALFEEEIEFLYSENTVGRSPSVTDQWILSFMQSLIGFFETEMAGECLSVCPPSTTLFVTALLILLLLGRAAAATDLGFTISLYTGTRHSLEKAVPPHVAQEDC